MASRLRLLLVHGAGGNSQVLRPLAAAAEATRAWSSVNCVDLASRKHEHELSVRDLAQQLLKESKISDATAPNTVIAGHSLGGAVATQAALLQPNLAGISLLSTAPRLKVGRSLLQSISEAAKHEEHISTEFAWEQGNLELIEAYNAAASSTAPLAALGDWKACNTYAVSEEVLQTIRVPACIVGGSADMMTPPKQSGHLQASIPNATLTMIEGGSHFLVIERADRVAAVLASFASSLGLDKEAKARL